MRDFGRVVYRWWDFFLCRHCFFSCMLYTQLYLVGCDIGNLPLNILPVDGLSPKFRSNSRRRSGRPYLSQSSLSVRRSISLIHLICHQEERKGKSQTEKKKKKITQHFIMCFFFSCLTAHFVIFLNHF